MNMVPAPEKLKMEKKFVPLQGAHLAASTEIGPFIYFGFILGAAICRMSFL